MRVVLDGVFNHIGDIHPWMDRYGQQALPGAYHGGPTRSYFTFSDDTNFATFLGVDTLPKLDYLSPEVHNEIYRSEKSVARYWLRPSEPGINDGIDGWRLDVPHMIGEGGTNRGNHEVLKGIRASVKAENQQAYIVGEHFLEATTWLQGDEEDGAINYFGFTGPTWAFLAATDLGGEASRLDAAAYDAVLKAVRAKIPFENQLAQLNLLNSHDTPRFMSLIDDPALVNIGVALLFTYIGVPCIYYGDEIGLAGGNNPDSRRTMPWREELWDQERLKLYRKLIEVRRQNSALQHGGMETLHAEGDQYAFLRRDGSSAAILVLNRGEASTSLTLNLPVTGVWLDVFSEEVITANFSGLSVNLKAKSFRLFLLG